MDLITKIVGYAKELYDVVKQVKANNKQCEALEERVSALSAALATLAKHANIDTFKDPLTRFLKTVTDILEFVKKFEGSKWFEQAVKKDDNEAEFEEFNKRLDRQGGDLHLALGIESFDRKMKLQEQKKIDTNTGEVKTEVKVSSDSELHWSSEFKHASVTLSNNNTTCTSSDGGQFQTVAGDVVWDKGVHQFEMEVTANGHAMFGLVPTKTDKWEGILGAPIIGGWGLFTGDTIGDGSGPWTIWQYGAIVPVIGQSGPERVIGIRVDLDKNTMEVFRGGFKDGKSIGVLPPNIDRPVRPAVTLYVGAVTIRAC